MLFDRALGNPEDLARVTSAFALPGPDQAFDLAVSKPGRHNATVKVTHTHHDTYPSTVMRRYSK
jgi:hypothetical protein